jgi:hypothetical protein
MSKERNVTTRDIQNTCDPYPMTKHDLMRTNEPCSRPTNQLRLHDSDALPLTVVIHELTFTSSNLTAGNLPPSVRRCDGIDLGRARLAILFDKIQ